MRKIPITLKIVQIEKNHIFSHYFLREKARQFGNTRLCILGAGQHIPSFASKLLLKEVICKKTVKNVFFQQNQVRIAKTLVL